MTSRDFLTIPLAAALATALLFFGACDKHDPKIVYGKSATDAHSKESVGAGKSAEEGLNEKSGEEKTKKVPADEVPKFFH